MSKTKVFQKHWVLLTNEKDHLEGAAPTFIGTIFDVHETRSSTSADWFDSKEAALKAKRNAKGQGADLYKRSTPYELLLGLRAAV